MPRRASYTDILKRPSAPGPVVIGDPESKGPGGTCIRIVLEPAAPDDGPAELARAGAERLAEAWWPAESEEVRAARVAALLEDHFPMIGSLAGELVRLVDVRVPGGARSVLSTIPAWPVNAAGRPVRPPTVIQLVRREAELLATIDARRAGHGWPAEEEAELAQVRAQLGRTRRKVGGRTMGHLAPALEKGAAQLGRAVAKLMPDMRRWREGLAGKPGLYRVEVLIVTHDILFALTGTRVPLKRLKSLIQGRG